MREDPDEDAALAAEEVRRGNASRLDLPGGDPRGLQALQPVIAEGNRVAAAGVAAHLAALAFAELHPLGHHGHKAPTTFSALSPASRP